MRLRSIIPLTLILGCDPTAADRPDVSICLGTCEDKELSATDRATCRLNCETGYTLGTASRPPALAPVAHCMGACGTDGADAKACVDACRDRDAAPAVLDALAVCVAGCQGSGAHGDDDRATCRLQCAQEAASPR